MNDALKLLLELQLACADKRKTMLKEGWSEESMDVLEATEAALRAIKQRIVQVATEQPEQAQVSAGTTDEAVSAAVKAAGGAQ